jgi:ClpP class serine protease
LLRLPGKNKLVDSLGGLFDAIKIAASKAKLKDYSVFLLYNF